MLSENILINPLLNVRHYGFEGEPPQLFHIIKVFSRDDSCLTTNGLIKIHFRFPCICVYIYIYMKIIILCLCLGPHKDIHSNDEIKNEKDFRMSNQIFVGFIIPNTFGIWKHF